MGRRFKSPSFQTLIKSNSAVVIAVDLRICGSLRFRQGFGVRLDSNAASSVAVRSCVGEKARVRLQSAAALHGAEDDVRMNTPLLSLFTSLLSSHRRTSRPKCNPPLKVY